MRSATGMSILPVVFRVCTQFTMFRLCTLEELIASKTKGFDLRLDGEPVGLLVAYKDGRLYGYRNSCPHVGVPLNQMPDQFLDLEEQYLQCSTHGAMFRIEDGYCEYGPCAGDRLDPVPVQLEDGVVCWSGAEQDGDPGR